MLPQAFNQLLEAWFKDWIQIFTDQSVLNVPTLLKKIASECKNRKVEFRSRSSITIAMLANDSPVPHASYRENGNGTFPDFLEFRSRLISIENS